MKNATYFSFCGQILTFQNLGQSENWSKGLILKEGPVTYQDDVLQVSESRKTTDIFSFSRFDVFGSSSNVRASAKYNVPTWDHKDLL